MSAPQLIEEMFFDDEISTFTISHDGSLIAIAILGLVGVYQLEKNNGSKRLIHLTSYVLPENLLAKTAFFSSDGEVLTIITNDKVRRDLAVFDRENGLMKELFMSNVSLTAA
ncbi:MAG: hypothetical protein ACOX2O_01905 [Bdellovibrionota bacterium]